MNSQIYSINKIVLMIAISILIVGGYVLFEDDTIIGYGSKVISPPDSGGFPETVSFSKTFVWFSNATDKIPKEFNPQVTNSKNDTFAKIKAAKNEYENFQIVVSSLSESDEKFSIEITDFIKLDGSASIIEKTPNIEMYEVNYVNVNRWIEWDSDGAPQVEGLNEPDQWMPDPLISKSIEENEFTVKSLENQPVWFTVYVPEDVPAGLYYATILVKFASGKIVPKKMELEVYDFTLPEEFGLRSLIGMYTIGYHFPESVSDESYNLIVEKYFEEFRRKRLNPFMYNPGFIPMKNSVIKHNISDGLLTIDDDTYSNFETFANEYLKNPDEKSFNTFVYRGPQHSLGDMLGDGAGDGSGLGLGVENTTENRLQWITLFSELQNYMQSEGLASKAVYYSVDEIRRKKLLNEDYIEKTTRLNDWINMGAPDLERIASVWLGGWNEKECDYKDTSGKNAIINSLENYIFPYNDHYLLSDGSKQFDTWILNSRGLIPDAISLIEERQELGENFWIYDNDILTSITHNYPPTNWYPLQKKEGIANRILPWILWKIDGKGLSNYAINHYGCVNINDIMYCNNPWKTPTNVAPDGTTIMNGTGFLFYPPCGKELGDDTIKCETETNAEIVPSIRWMLLGEGMEDYEYFKILENKMIGDSSLIGEDAMNNAMSLVSTCYYDFEGNSVKYYNAKDRIANAIEILQ